MKPPRFDYADPTTVEEAVSLLAERDGEAKILAGGQSLMPLLNMRLARPSLVVDMRKVPELDYIREAGGGLAIGALTRERTIERSALVKEAQPLLRAATQLIGHPQIRNRGTIGGSLSHADPAAEYPATALVLDAEFVTAGARGQRAIRASEFFVSFFTTALEPSEILTEVRLPAMAERTGWAVQEVARRRGDFALAGVTATVTLGEGNKISDARIVLFGVAATPTRAKEAEQVLVGEPPGEELFGRAGQKASEEIGDPLSDVHGSAEYRKHLAGVLTRRTLIEAVARAEGDST